MSDAMNRNRYICLIVLEAGKHNATQVSYMMLPCCTLHDSRGNEYTKAQWERGLASTITDSFSQFQY